MSLKDEYLRKRMSAHDAVALVGNGDRIVVPTAVGEPPALLSALADRRRDFDGVSIAQILPMGNYGYFDAETTAHVSHLSYFLSAASRPGARQGWIDTLASNFSEMPQLFRKGLTPSDVVFSLASPMDEHGYFSLSLGTDYIMAAIEQARVVVLEVNPNVPFAFGNCHVHLSRVSAVTETDAPLREVGLPQIGPVQEAIGGHVAERIADGSTLQIGYGAIPDAVVMQLKNKTDLGIHTEMMGDGLLSLIECGAVTNRRKNFMPGKSVATFALGSGRLYRYMNRNPGLEMHPVDFTNDPWSAARNDNLISINATMQIDLFGQCGSESLGPVPYSGTGGQSDFVRAANRSDGGKSFIVLPSTAKDGTISRIVPVLQPGTLVTTSKNDISAVVTEYGVAELRGKPMRERARALVSIAHPDFRDWLSEEASKMQLV